MTPIDRLLRDNQSYAAARATLADPRPGRRLAVVTCMDSRIDLLPALGLHLGEAMVLRNAGGRVTSDVVRSLAVATHVLGVEAVVVMQHTGCGIAGTTDDELRRRTGADVEFRSFTDHARALGEDVETLAATPYLAPVGEIAGLVYDVHTGKVDEVVRWRRTP